MSSTPDAVPRRDLDPTGPGHPGPGDPAATGPSTDVAPDRRRRLLRLVAVLAVVVLAVDQATKAWAVATLTEGERTDVVGDLLGLTLLRNPGAALSIATGMTWVLTLVAVVVVVVTVRASRRIGSRAWAVALGLLLGGAIGNLVDRFARTPGPGRGHVVDFIAYGDLFVGNVADVAIVGAAGLIVLLALRGIGLDGTREHASGDHAPRTGHPAHRAEPTRRPVGRAHRAEEAAPPGTAGPRDGGDAGSHPPTGPPARPPADARAEAPAEDRLRG